MEVCVKEIFKVTTFTAPRDTANRSQYVEQSFIKSLSTKLWTQRGPEVYSVRLMLTEMVAVRYCAACLDTQRSPGDHEGILSR